MSNVLYCLKGGTSRLLRAEFLELEEFLWGRHFWADGYFAETVGLVEEAVVRRYIQNQSWSLREPDPGAKTQGNRGAHKPV